MAKIIVTIKHTVPLMDYGNTIIEATQEIDISEGDDIQIWTDDTIAQVRKALALAILPLVEAEVERCMSVLLKEGAPDNWMRRNSKIYQWFRLAYPEVDIPAMAKLDALVNTSFGADNAAKLKAYESLNVNRGAASLKE